MKLVFLMATAFAVVFGASAASAAGVERLYVLDCGRLSAPDQSRWSPGVNVGVPIELSDNCYLIRHAQGWFLWDTGLTDALAASPEGRKDPNSGLTAARSKTLSDQLAQLGVKPSDIKGIGISHTHPDHIGNVEEFPQVTLYVQKAEYEWPNADGTPRFKPEHPVTKLEGDHDVFGDGSVVFLSTPGHTPGHQSLLCGCRKPARSCFLAMPRISKAIGIIGACRGSTLTRNRLLLPCSALPIFWRRSTRSYGSIMTNRRATRRRSLRISTNSSSALRAARINRSLFRSTAD